VAVINQKKPSAYVWPEDVPPQPASPTGPPWNMRNVPDRMMPQVTPMETCTGHVFKSSQMTEAEWRVVDLLLAKE
jgi:hypothetical protein